MAASAALCPALSVRLWTFSFKGADLPEIYDAVYVDLDDDSTLVCEVQQHLGDGAVRALAMSTTDGLRRGMEGYSNRRSHHRACRPGYIRAYL